jgi:hypothetical protein
MGGEKLEGKPLLVDVQLVDEPGAESADVAVATVQLRRELLQLDVDSVEQVTDGPPPPGSRAVDLAALGALVITMAKSELLPAVVATVQSWLARSRRRSIKLEIDGDVLELTGLGAADQRRLADEWLRRHEA